MVNPTTNTVVVARQIPTTIATAIVAAMLMITSPGMQFDGSGPHQRVTPYLECG